MVHFPKRDLSEASLALERGYHLTKLLARLSVYLADDPSSQHTIVRLGSLQEKDSQIRIPAFYVIRPAKSTREAPAETLLVSLHLPIEQVNSEPEIFNRFVFLQIEYAQESGYEFEYDRELFEKTDEGWKVIKS